MNGCLLENGWMIDRNQKLIFKKSIPLWSCLISSLGISKTPVTVLWSMCIRGYIAKKELANLPFPMEHDNFPKPEKYPFYFRLTNGWTIDNSSLKFLKNGPLFSEDGLKVLVSETMPLKSMSISLWKFITALSTMLGILSGLAWIISII
jgi:hypothetical protein